MIKKFNNLNIYKNHFFFLFLITVIHFLYIYFFANIHGHWANYIDSEILWPYNTLLILSGEKIEFDAYGFFYHILQFKFFQILDFFNFLKITNIYDLNSGKNFSENLENLIFAGRWFNVLIIYTTIIIAYLIFFNLSRNHFFSFIISLIFMLSPGMTQQLSHSRVDILASTLTFLSFFYLIKFAENKNKLNYILFIIIFILSIFTKVQSYLLLFTLFLSSAYFINHKKKFKIHNNFNSWINLLLFIFVLFCIFYPLVFHRHAKFSILFLYSQLILLNIFFYFIFRKNKNFLRENLLFTSITFFIIIIFIVVINKISYMHHSAVRITFFEPMEIRMYLGVTELKGMDVITLDFKKNITYFYILFKEIIRNFLSNFLSVMTQFSSNMILIMTNFILFFYQFYIKKNKKEFFIILPVLSFFIINGINTIRPQPLELYLTYSEFMLYIPLCIYFRKNSFFSKKFLYFCLIITLFIPIILSPERYNKNRFTKNDNFKNTCEFLFVYAKRISKEEIKKICH